MKSLCFSAACCVLISGIAMNASASVIYDGSFEYPNMKKGQETDYFVGEAFKYSNPSHWNVVGPGGARVSVLAGPVTISGITYHAAVGRNFLDLTGNGANQAEGVAQTFTTVVGTTYTLSFQVGNVVDNSGSSGISSTVNVYVNGFPLCQAPNTMGSTMIFWLSFSCPFPATTTTTTITIINADPPGDNFNGLDDVSISP